MDDRRFDDLTKLVGRRASRRTVIRAAIAGTIASVFGGSIAEAALSPIKTRPRLCIQPGQPCAAPGTDPSRDCCYKCNNKTHKCCEDVGYLCTVDSHCCVKLVNGRNVQLICRDPQAAGTDRRKACFLPGTLNPGAQCSQGGDCASGNCVNGVCSACPTGTTVCGANCCNTAQCQVCVNGVCKSKCGPCQRCENGTCVNICDNCHRCVNNQCVAKCNVALCQTCNPTTGVCETCAGNKCQSCVNGQCVPKCNRCQTCDAVTGVCTPIPCQNLCDVCNPTTGVCGPKTCGPCQVCDPADGACKSTCAACQLCQNGVCVDNCPGECDVCDLVTGQCGPKVCADCSTCNPDTGICETGCADCEICDPYLAVCVDNCPAYLCQQCDPIAGICVDFCGPCETCDGGVCYTDCLDCQVCDESSDVCVDDCDPCLTCDPATETCLPDACVTNDTCCGGACTCGNELNPEKGFCQQPFFQGFETDTSGWSAPITRVASGAGTNGIPSATGAFHAEAGNDTNFGPFTRLGGYSNVFPAGGFTVSVDIYLDPSAASLSNDTRFDWAVAINTPDCTFRRDFVFNAGFYNDDTTAPGTGNRFIISGSNNSGRANSNPYNPGNNPIAITTSGWYTFIVVFRDAGAGVLAGDLSIIDSSNATVGSWTRSDASDVIGLTVGGNRYGWFVTQEFPFIAIDNSSRI